MLEDIRKLDIFTLQELVEIYNILGNAIIARGGTTSFPTNPTPPTPKQFRFGQLVQFADRGGKMRTARVEKVNRKSLTVRTIDDHSKWRVSPSLCSLAPQI